MKRLIIGLVFFLTAALVTFYWPKGDLSPIVDTTMEPVITTTEIEQVPVAITSVADATEPAKPIIPFGRSTTLPEPLWPHRTNILNFYAVFDLWVAQSTDGIPGLNPSISADESYEDYLIQVEEERKRFDDTESVRALASQKIAEARQKLELVLGTNLVPLFADWSETNGISGQDLAKTRVVYKGPLEMSGRY